MGATSDPFDDALQDLRIGGSLLLHESYVAPWAIDIPDEARLRALLGVDANTRVALFHFVRRGSFELQLADAEVVTVPASTVAICATGAAHRMRGGRGGRPVPIDQVLRGRSPVQGAGRPGEETELVCGAFYLQASPLNPLLAALPPVMTVNTADASFSPLLTGIVWMLAHEIDRHALSGFTVGRLLELFCAEAIRAYQRDEGGRAPGFFKALADPRVGEAIRCVHVEPGRPWSVDVLASAAALSPSRFAARFKAATGMPVMTYVSRWRANVACRLLQDGRLSLSEIAQKVGYDSPPAFSRAFKAQLGTPPAVWRSDRLRSGPPRA